MIRLREMLPDPPVLDQGDRHVADRELLGQPPLNLAGSDARPNLDDLSICEARATLPLPVCHAALCDCVSRILCWCTCEKMLRVHAGRVVATMADEHPFGDGTVGYLVGDTVRTKPSHFSVSTGAGRPEPMPASTFHHHPSDAAECLDGGFLRRCAVGDTSACRFAWVSLPPNAGEVHIAVGAPSPGLLAPSDSARFCVGADNIAHVDSNPVGQSPAC